MSLMYPPSMPPQPCSLWRVKCLWHLDSRSVLSLEEEKECIQSFWQNGIRMCKGATRAGCYMRNLPCQLLQSPTAPGPPQNSEWSHSAPALLISNTWLSLLFFPFVPSEGTPRASERHLGQWTTLLFKDLQLHHECTSRFWSIEK